jgi:DNA-binding response OmpR family regulator
MAMRISALQTGGVGRPVALIVEDDSDIRQALAEVVELAGFEAATVAHGLEALRWLRNSDDLPEVVLLDLMMPVMDGYQFLASRDDVHKQVPVVVLTAKSEPRVPAGITVLRKPVSFDALFAAILPFAR